MLQWLHTRRLVDSGGMQRRSGPSFACRHGSAHMHAHQFRAQGDEGRVEARKVQQRHDDQRLPVRWLQRARHRSHLHAHINMVSDNPACQFAPASSLAAARPSPLLPACAHNQVCNNPACRSAPGSTLAAARTPLFLPACAHVQVDLKYPAFPIAYPKQGRVAASWHAISSSIDAHKLASNHGWLYKRAGCDQAGGPFAAMTASHLPPSRCQAARQPPLHAAH